MVLLASSLPNGNTFINTMNLDGETNLKRRTGKPELVTPYSPSTLLLFWQHMFTVVEV